MGEESGDPPRPGRDGPPDGRKEDDHEQGDGLKVYRAYRSVEAATEAPSIYGACHAAVPSAEDATKRHLSAIGRRAASVRRA